MQSKNQEKEIDKRKETEEEEKRTRNETKKSRSPKETANIAESGTEDKEKEQELRSKQMIRDLNLQPVSAKSQIKKLSSKHYGNNLPHIPPNASQEDKERPYDNQICQELPVPSPPPEKAETITARIGEQLNYARRTPTLNPKTCPHLRTNKATQNKEYCYDCCRYVEVQQHSQAKKRLTQNRTFLNTETCPHITTNPIGTEGKAYCCDCGVYIDLNETNNSTSSSETNGSDKSSSNTRENKTKAKVRPQNAPQQSIGKMMFATALIANSRNESSSPKINTNRLKKSNSTAPSNPHESTYQNTITDEKNNKQKATTASETSINYMNHDAKETLKRMLLQETNRTEYFRQREKEIPQANIAVIQEHITTKRHKSLESKEVETKRTRINDKCDVIRYTEGLWRQQEECIDKSSLNVIRPTKRKSRKNRHPKEDIGQARIRPEIIQESEENARRKAWELHAEINEITENMKKQRRTFS